MNSFTLWRECMSINTTIFRILIRTIRTQERSISGQPGLKQSKNSMKSTKNHAKIVERNISRMSKRKNYPAYCTHAVDKGHVDHVRGGEPIKKTVFSCYSITQTTTEDGTHLHRHLFLRQSILIWLIMTYNLTLTWKKLKSFQILTVFWNHAHLLVDVHV